MTAVREAMGTEAETEARTAGRVLPLETAASEALVLTDELAGYTAGSS
jgi:hypothetical protein